MEALDANLRNNIWKEKLNAELNYRCYNKLSERFSLVDSILKYSLAIATVTTSLEAFLSVIDPSGLAVKILAVVASFLAVINVTFQYQKKISCTTKAKVSFHKIWKDFDDLWLKIESNSIAPDKVFSIRKSLMDEFVKIDNDEGIYRISKSIIKESQQEVLVHNGLQGK